MIHSLTDKNILGAMPTSFVLALAIYGLFSQITQIPAAVGDIGSALATAEHLTLTGALIIAVFILWKSLVKKDDAQAETVRVVAGALASATAANIELRKTVEELKSAIQSEVRR